MAQTHRWGLSLTRLLAGIVFMVWGTVSARAADFVVIANPAVSANSLSRAELKAIFLGEKVKWDNKKHIRIVILENGLAYVDFLQTIVGKTPSQYDQHWMKLVYTGRGSIPPSFIEEHQVIEYVTKQPHAIGFVSPGNVTGADKIIAIK